MKARQAEFPPLDGGTFHIHTFGCQMNENDSEYLAGILAGLGLTRSSTPEGAAVIIVNTCSVRAKSEEKLYSLLGRLLPLKRESGGLLGVVGCAAQIQRARLLERFAGLDFVAGPDNYHRLPEILSRSRSEACLALDRSPDWVEAGPRPFVRQSPVVGLVTIMEGCDNFCSYCVVPFARGREKYRPARHVLGEVRGLARAGYLEIDLLGQNVNSYRDPETGTDFASLLAAVGDVEGPEWIRFITSHPKDFSPGLIRAMAQTPRVCGQLHLPLQSGSTAVLGRMNRGYGRKDYLDLVASLREAMPSIALSTDIIVGFPGETETEFEETLTALELIRFASIFSFRYSPRPMTAAARLPDDVPPEVKRRRLIQVQDRQKKIQAGFNREAVGRTDKVLGLGLSKKSSRVYSGRNEAAQVVNFEAPPGIDPVGRFVRVEITACGPYSLRGKLREG
jgi:tRNA-2-methylthio-N6-dimethylallyladenosine synthase